MYFDRSSIFMSIELLIDRIKISKFSKFSISGISFFVYIFLFLIVFTMHFIAESFKSNIEKSTSPTAFREMVQKLDHATMQQCDIILEVRKVQ